ncbi:IucA/IucC family siderophore biosynthesis protein [Halobacillus shinanisalinarum]|uniref:IucA/IucC family siderophore biosynthesis protein n=1 Tax=Halobacillus shinanisalinarum TaxID=2932258 RepID=A0ABY4H2B7_9BACI|nr:IucA/IucC family protein [Halobacillus shinanisalinarum]UOQ94308.1 IucA/IucC family siderophore biosynthesis protein [Halobacillus shinanisalinarum]
MTQTTLMAEQATMQSFVNCYLRETGQFKIESSKNLSQLAMNVEKVIVCELPYQNRTLFFPVDYWSLTGRHKLIFPLYLKTGERDELVSLDYITLVSLITKELSLKHRQQEAQDELMLRVILSCQNMKRYIENRREEAEKLVGADFDFIEAEQSLLLGHLLHPTPKSKQGISNKEDNLYSPEMKGEFQLHYFRADKDYIVQGSSLADSAGDQMIEQLNGDPEIDVETLERILEKSENSVVFPVHPLQAKQMLEDDEVLSLMDKKELVYLGPLGSKYSPTSSFRTVFRKDSKYMYKFSLPIKITNSLRINQQKELDRGVEVSNLLKTGVGESLSNAYPSFQVIQDPAYIKLKLPHSNSAYDVVLRNNPFRIEGDQVTLIAGLCQDHAYSQRSRLQVVIEKIARAEGRSLEAVSLDWFKRYLSLTLEPLMWLYKTYGIALEAHQQNSLVKLENGYPVHFYYRDNQGYYFSESKADLLRSHLPRLNEESDTICSDTIAVERFRYYFFINHLFGLINSFGMNGLIKEEYLLDVLRERLAYHNDQTNELLNSLLNDSTLPCKANLLTRFYDLDELVGSLENQSVYTFVDNPLCKEAQEVYGT